MFYIENCDGVVVCWVPCALFFASRCCRCQRRWTARGRPGANFFYFFFARPREREWVECPVWLFGLSLCLPVRRLCARCPRLVARLHTRTQKARLHGVGQPIGLSKWGDRLRPASATDYYDYSITTTCNTKKATFVSVTRGAAGSVVWHFAMHTKNKAPKQKKDWIVARFFTADGNTQISA